MFVPLLRAAWNATVVENDPILTTFGTEVGVHVESMGKFSYQKAFRLRGDLKTFPIHTAVITVDEGEVSNNGKHGLLIGWFRGLEGGCRGEGSKGRGT